jgi:hypothetical protein
MYALIKKHLFAATALLTISIGVAGCTNPPAPAEHPNTNALLTWQQAKASTQQRAQEIAALVPAAQVVNVESKDTGVLLSCTSTKHSWNGWVIMTVTSDTDVRAVIESIGSHFEGSTFQVATDNDIEGDLRVQLVAADGEESYLVSQDADPNLIRISGSSACFTLPDGVYPGGDF